MLREPLPALCLQVGFLSTAPANPSPIDSLYLDFLKDEKAFLARVEEDATTFRPTGQMIYTYTRPAPHSSASKSKGKSVAQPQTLDPESEDAVVFEVYHVGCPSHLFIYFLSPPTSGNMEFSWFQGTSPTNAAFHTALYRSRLVYQRGGRDMGIPCPVRGLSFFMRWAPFTTQQLREAKAKNHPQCRYVPFRRVFITVSLLLFPGESSYATQVCDH